MKITKGSTVAWTDALVRGNYQQRRKPLGQGKLACSVFELAPGKKSFPLHAHMVTEEALYVISGTAKVRTPDGLSEIGPGDFVAFPAKGPAHQLVNDGGEAFVYLAMSTNPGDVDVIEYPDSKKVAYRVGEYPSGTREIFKHADAADYFTDDPDAG